VSNAERIAVVGLGYVGLPLAVALDKAGFDVTAFDIDRERVEALKRGEDVTGEVEPATLLASKLRYTARARDLARASFFIIAVPTPLDEKLCPDLRALRGACRTVGRWMRPGAVVVVESTVYPGTTEEICAVELAQASGRTCGVDFRLGYSPERINPGDAAHSVADVVKVVAGQDAETLERVAAVYARAVPAGIHRAPSIVVAETAKAIENAQRDLNIALMNELAKICHLLGIRTGDVLAAAATKWNFLRFHPGLVGGHCIGVDPYYLTARAQALGYHPEVILAGRRINSGMAAYVAHQLIRLLLGGDGRAGPAQVGVLGLTFKENVPDIRNSAVFDIISTLRDFGVGVIAHDPLADPARVQAACGCALHPLDAFHDLDALILAVPHRAYDGLAPDRLATMLAPSGVFVDVRSRFVPEAFGQGIRYWAL